MDYKLNGNTLTIYLNGRVDSNNASAVESEIASIREANSHTALVLDAEKLEYLSSAGLRIVLRLKKAVNDMKIVGVSPDVYEIFDMTGFTEMMTVEKAYRVISVDGCEVIGQGANGKVYRISGDTIVKVYLSPDSLDDIKRERDLAKKAFVLGVPTAISYDVARIAGGGYGSVFELLNATSLAKKLAAEPDKFDAIIGLYVDLLKKIHSTVVKKGDMPDMRLTAIKWAQFDKSYLPEGLGDKLISMVEAIPDCDNMIHGDYHVKNVMYQDGEALLIDMDTLSVGNPVFEFGSIYNAYAGFSEIDHTIVKSFLGLDRSFTLKIWKTTLRLYFAGATEAELEKIEAKAQVVGYMRLLRRTIRRNGFEGNAEAKFYLDRLTDALGAVDDLIL